MPTTYAHSSFGKYVLNYLDTDVKEIINKNIDLFNIGLHGPDILFYYKPLSTNEVNKTGHKLHSSIVSGFIKRSVKIINDCENKEASFAYIAGFICHYMLDSECHPYVRQKEMTGISHSTIEAEFERYLMIKDNIEPISFKPTKHIVPKEEYAKYISLFYEGISWEEVFSAIKSMKFYLNLLVAPGGFKRNVLITSLKLTHNENMIDLIISCEPNKECIDSSSILTELYSNAIVPTAEIVNEFYKDLKSGKELNNRFNRNFG